MTLDTFEKIILVCIIFSLMLFIVNDNKTMVDLETALFECLNSQ